MADGTAAASDFTLDDENDHAFGIWSNGVTFFVADFDDGKIYTYRPFHDDSDLPPGDPEVTEVIAPVPLVQLAVQMDSDFNTLQAAGNTRPRGIWSDGTTMWVAHKPNYSYGETGPKLYAYNLATRERDSGKDFDTLHAAGNYSPTGIWSDGTTMWVADNDDKVYAYDMSTKARAPDEDFSIGAGTGPVGIWSDGTTIWVARQNYRDIRAYDLESKERRAPPGFHYQRSGVGS